jgi:hypothetical protein
MPTRQRRQRRVPKIVTERPALLGMIADSKRELRAAGAQEWIERHIVAPGYGSHSVQNRVKDVRVPTILVRHPPGCGCPEVKGARYAPPDLKPGVPWHMRDIV